MCRGNNKRKLFFRPKDYKLFWKMALLFKQTEKVKIYHYALMPNHFHFMVGVDDNSDLAKFIQRLSLTYYYYFKKRHQCVGHLWQGRFKSKVIDDEAYYLQCGKYIELNPVRARLISKPEAYPFSSYRVYVLGVADKLVDIDPYYIELGSSIIIRQQFYLKTIINENIKKKIDCTHQNEEVQSDLLQPIDYS
ncbi:MAG: transposase [Candidatus Omnitrophica bacterium]|nr:transposase [Candidatus Omnitrophota bacterium]MBU1929185.1 transposase [Candidatus Omnitrophota bacterium]